jgi:hypothetical protein
MILFGGTITDVVILGPNMEIVVDRWILEWPGSVDVMENGYIQFDLAASS